MTRLYRAQLDALGPAGRDTARCWWLYFVLAGALNPIVFSSIFLCWLLVCPVGAHLLSPGTGADPGRPAGAQPVDDPLGAPPATAPRRASRISR